MLFVYYFDWLIRAVNREPQAPPAFNIITFFTQFVFCSFFQLYFLKYYASAVIHYCAQALDQDAFDKAHSPDPPPSNQWNNTTQAHAPASPRPPLRWTDSASDLGLVVVPARKYGSVGSCWVQPAGMLGSVGSCWKARDASEAKNSPRACAEMAFLLKKNGC